MVDVAIRRLPDLSELSSQDDQHAQLSSTVMQELEDAVDSVALDPAKDSAAKTAEPRDSAASIASAAAAAAAATAAATGAPTNTTDSSTAPVDVNSILKGLWTPPVRAADPDAKTATKNVRSENSVDSNSSNDSSNSGTLPAVPSGSADAPAPVPLHPSAAAAAAAAMAAVRGGSAPRDSSPPAAPLDPAQVVSLALSKLPSTSLPSVPSGGSVPSLGHSVSMSGAHSAAQVARLQQELEALKAELQQANQRVAEVEADNKALKAALEEAKAS